MSTILRRVVTITSCCVLSACDRGTPIAGELVLGAKPTEVRFAPPIASRGADRTVCLTFDPSGDSRRAHEVLVVLVTTEGARDTLQGRIDRTGESRVCLADTSAMTDARLYSSVEFSAPTSLRVGRIEWRATRARH